MCFAQTLHQLKQNNASAKMLLRRISMKNQIFNHFCKGKNKQTKTQKTANLIDQSNTSKYSILVDYFVKCEENVLFTLNKLRLFPNDKMK